MMYTRLPYRNAGHRGFTLLFAVLISTILLAIGAAIFNVTIKQLALSTVGRESQFAFYAADTGAECAMYWDIKNNGASVSAFTPDPRPDGDPDPLNRDIFCSGNNLPVGSRTRVNCNPYSGSGLCTDTFTYQIVPGVAAEPACVTVTVTKQNATYDTIIESRGYNTCDTNDPRRVERAVRVRY